MAAAIARNWIAYGEPTLSRNAAYNLYIGNQDVYAEDLDLFHPRATPEQIEFRRQFFAGTLQYPTAPPPSCRARRWPGLPVTRAVPEARDRTAGPPVRAEDRRARVGRRRGGRRRVLTDRLTLLGVANLQWTWMLFAGLLGLAALIDRDRSLGVPFLATIVGCAILCLIAIAKPRYSFVFDPLLILTATLVVSMSAADRVRRSGAAHWKVLAPSYVFLVWGWIAWTIFAMSSRLAR